MNATNTMNAAAAQQVYAPQQPAYMTPEQAAYWNASAAPQTYAQQYVQPYAHVQDPVERQSDSFSRTSSALVMLGLVMLGGAIAPLLAFFQVQAAAKFFIGLAYIIVCCLTISWLAGRMFRHSERRDTYVRVTRVGVLMVGEAVLLAFASTCAPFELRWEVSACVLAAILPVLHVAVSKGKREAAYTPLRVNECLVMLTLAPLFLSAGSWSQVPAQTLIALTVALALIAVAVALRVLELAQEDATPKTRQGWLLVGTAFSFTALAAAYVYGCMPFGHSPYVYDVVFMASALACAGLGFRYCAPALRVTGLVFALLTVAKMITLDTIGLDPLPKAIAYLVGGAVCFGIGAMYSYAVKRMDASKQ